MVFSFGCFEFCRIFLCNRETAVGSFDRLIKLFFICFFFSILDGNDEYLSYEDNLLPEFPFTQPAAFQIFESDCKINPTLVDQLRYKYFECHNTNAEEFINENLSMMLTRTAASVYSWSGTQGNHPLSKFKTMKVLIGLFQSQ